MNKDLSEVFSNKIDYRQRFKFLCEKYSLTCEDVVEAIDKLLGKTEVKPICILSIFKDGSYKVDGDQGRFVGLEFSNPCLTKFLLKTE